jgi:putative exporter of polyketide antibiotics
LDSRGNARLWWFGEAVGMKLSPNAVPLVVVLLVERLAELLFIPGMGVETRPPSAVSGATAAIVIGGFLLATVFAIVGLVAAKSRPKVTAFAALAVAAVFVATLLHDLASLGGPLGPLRPCARGVHRTC